MSRRGLTVDAVGVGRSEVSGAPGPRAGRARGCGCRCHPSPARRRRVVAGIVHGGLEAAQAVVVPGAGARKGELRPKPLWLNTVPWVAGGERVADQAVAEVGGLAGAGRPPRPRRCPLPSGWSGPRSRCRRDELHAGERRLRHQTVAEQGGWPGRRGSSAPRPGHRCRRRPAGEEAVAADRTVACPAASTYRLRPRVWIASGPTVTTAMRLRSNCACTALRRNRRTAPPHTTPPRGRLGLADVVAGHHTVRAAAAAHVHGGAVPVPVPPTAISAWLSKMELSSRSTSPLPERPRQWPRPRHSWTKSPRCPR